MCLVEGHEGVAKVGPMRGVGFDGFSPIIEGSQELGLGSLINRYNPHPFAIVTKKKETFQNGLEWER